MDTSNNSYRAQAAANGMPYHNAKYAHGVLDETNVSGPYPANEKLSKVVAYLSPYFFWAIVVGLTAGIGVTQLG